MTKSTSTTVKNNPVRQERSIILFLALFLVAGLFLSAYTEKKQLSAPSNAGWELYFDDPKSSDLTFAIHNGGKKSSFHWKELSADGDVITQGDLNIPSGQSEKVTPAPGNSSEKITIEVSRASGDKKDIYKN